MKKVWSIVLILVLVMGALGCSGQNETSQESSAATESSAVTDSVAEESVAEESVAEESVAEESAGEAQSEDKTTAESFVGKDAQELIDAIGEPESTAYQDSCAVANAQDGFWTYDGFTVVTLKTAEGETVQEVR